LRAGRIFSSSRYITGTFLDCNRHAVLRNLSFQQLTGAEKCCPFWFW